MTDDASGGRAGEGDHPGTLPWYVSGRLEAGGKEAVRRHLAGCDSCRREVEALTMMREAMRQPGGTDHAAPSDLVAYEEGALASEPDRAAAIAEHLRVCAGCAEEIVALRQSRRTLEELPPLPERETTAPRETAARRETAAPHAPAPARGATGTTWKLALLAAAASAVLLTVWPARRAAPSPSVPGPGPIATVTLKRPVRGAEEAAVLDGSGPWAVTLLLPFGAAADEYDLTIFRDGAPITAVPVRLRARAEGTASFLLPGLPAEGRYVVQLAPAGSATGEALEYSFDHRAAAPDHGTSANR